MQIQHAFGGLGLTELGRMELKIYLQIPDFQNVCPLCGGAGCVVRHGLYYRLVVDVEGSVIERFPVPRFRCRGRSGAVTFSVLPSTLVPRRRFSLPLMLLILDLVRRRRSIPAVLDRLAEIDRGHRGALLVEATTVYRVLALFARAYPGLSGEGLRARALAAARTVLAAVAHWQSTPIDREPSIAYRETLPREVHDAKSADRRDPAGRAP